MQLDLFTLGGRFLLTDGAKDDLKCTEAFQYHGKIEKTDVIYQPPELEAYEPSTSEHKSQAQV